MDKKVYALIVVGFAAMTVVGCATSKQQIMKNRVTELEQQLAEKDRQIEQANTMSKDADIVFDDSMTQEHRVRRAGRANLFRMRRRRIRTSSAR